MPDKEWKHFFGETRDVSIVCSPWKISDERIAEVNKKFKNL